MRRDREHGRGRGARRCPHGDVPTAGYSPPLPGRAGPALRPASVAAAVAAVTVPAATPHRYALDSADRTRPPPGTRLRHEDAVTRPRPRHQATPRHAPTVALSPNHARQPRFWHAHPRLGDRDRDRAIRGVTRGRRGPGRAAASVPQSWVGPRGSLAGLHPFVPQGWPPLEGRHQGGSSLSPREPRRSVALCPPGMGRFKGDPKKSAAPRPRETPEDLQPPVTQGWVGLEGTLEKSAAPCPPKEARGSTGPAIKGHTRANRGKSSGLKKENHFTSGLTLNVVSPGFSRKGGNPLLPLLPPAALSA